MSGYRSYVPWKSNLPTGSYKSGASSAYSSRDDVANDTKSTPRFGSIASTSAYRPSYSGGTYRSAKSLQPTVPISTSNPYLNRYASSNSRDVKSETGNKESTKKPNAIQQPKYASNSSNKENGLSQKTSRYSTSTGNLSKYGRRSRDPSPVTATLAIPKVVTSREPSPVASVTVRARVRNTPETISVSKNLLRPRSRDLREPSPAASNTTPLRARSRDIREPSPAVSLIRGQSRDPSPAAADSSLRNRISSTTTGFSTSPYRLFSSRNSSQNSSKYGVSNSNSNSSNSMGRSALPDKALSYMSASDAKAAAAKTAIKQKERREKAAERAAAKEAEIDKKSSSATNDSSHSTSESISSLTLDKSGELEESLQIPEFFTPVSVVSRGTSPTPPGVSTVTRNRRTDLAKTIEKTLQRSSRKPPCSDREIQSDRLDDPTKYSRFNIANRIQSAIPYIASLAESRSSKSSPKSSKSSNSDTDTNSSDAKKKDEPLSSSSAKGNLPRSNSTKSLTKSDKSKSLADTKQKSQSKQHLVPGGKQKSTENSSSSRSLPPTVPKSESPTKSSSSSSAASNSKWLNKDFRKSALNVGPTDRPRKSRTPSTDSAAEEKCEQSKIPLSIGRVERSPSVGSEASAVTATSSQSSSEDDSKRCHPRQKTTSLPTSSSSGGKKYLAALRVTDLSARSDEQEINNSAASASSSASGGSNRPGSCNKNNEATISSNITTADNHSANKSFGMRNKAKKQSKQLPTSESSAAAFKNENSSSGSDASKTSSYLLKKLGSVSNFFVVARSQDPNAEAIHLDKTSSSSSFSNALQQDVSSTTNFTLSQFLPVTTATACKTKSTEAETTDLDESSWWNNTSQQVDTESALDMKYKLRHIDSGELDSWWDQNDVDNTIADDLRTLNQQDEVDHSENTDISISERTWWPRSNNTEMGTNNTNSESIKSYKIRPIDSGECPWWLSEKNASNDATENDLRTTSNEIKNENSILNRNSPQVNCPQSPAAAEDDNSFDTKSAYKIRPVESGERAWWLTENNENSNSAKDAEVNENIISNGQTNSSPSPYRIRRVQSGETGWWLNNSNDVGSPDVKKSPQPENSYSSQSSLKNPYRIRRIESGEKAWWLQDDSVEQKTKQQDIQEQNEDNDDSDLTDDGEVQHVIINGYNRKNSINRRSLYDNGDQSYPLGDRASPEGLEDTSKNRKSPYDNVPISSLLAAERAERNRKLFISRHRNIDDVLGGSCRPLSPLMDRILNNKSVFLEEITPAQVRIHDSTAQMPIIQRMERDKSWEYSDTINKENQQQQQMMPDDAALQVYKDGDYGTYLDLESSLAEQAEEIEGLNSSRKNSIVVRTQLSVRVHAIIEKLLSAEGSELRRALFSLKQIFQEDKDLVHGFVALGGLNCLVRVGNGADQNYQNYILRALGQVMLYVDGMNGVMKHGPTIQWLYSLIASKYRLVVKTALKLLLVFVEYVESNCYLLVNAIHAVDNAQGALPWSNIMRLLKDYENADTELLIYATSLINKTLSGLSDQDSFYDESDFLEQQGMEGVIQRYMSRQGTDLDLLDQLQLYEAVLKFEDGESDGIRISDSSVRKTLRYRSSNDSAERRKSRRHSTGTSPSIMKSMAQQKPYTPVSQQVLDEDSSSSNNSNEFSAGVFRDCKGQRDGAGVTPGLRRRRERAERQKTFMREQQEAVANGLRSPFEQKDDLNGHVQIVTAVPVQLKNIDSPPESLLNDSSNCHSPIISNGNVQTRTGENSINHHKLLRSPVKNLLSNTSISVITKSFDKTHSNINNNGIELVSQNPLLNGNTAASPTPPLNGSLRNSSDFLTNKNFVMKTNSTVISGLMKNLNRNDKNNLRNIPTTDTIASAGCGGGGAGGEKAQIVHKKFENDSNRLNNYYSKIAAVTKNTNNNVIIPKIGENNFTSSDSSSNVPVKNGITNNGYQRNGNTTATSVSTTTASTATQSNSCRIMGKSKDTSNCSALMTNGNGQTTDHITTVSNGNSPETEAHLGSNGNTVESENDDKKFILQLKRDHTVKDLTQKLSTLPMSPQDEKPQNRGIGDMTGLISKAKEGLAKSKSKGEISRSPSVDQELRKSEPKKSENELHWEELIKNMTRPLTLCDLDFTDLNSEDEKDVLATRTLGGSVPPPPPPIGIPPVSGIMVPPAPPSIGGMMMMMPPQGFNQSQPSTNFIPPPGFNFNNQQNLDNGTSTIKKNKKTVKLFWKEVREDLIPPTVGKTIWDELPNANVDTQKLEHLFESRAKDLMTKKHQELNKNKEIIVLDHKRSNAINIAMTKLPPPRAIKTAILKMDATVVTREGIDKLLNMLPTDEERGKIQEAQVSNPELPLGSAEQFLLTLSSISELAARLKLWAFKLDFENSEKEIAEPLMDLKQGVELLKANRTFKCILSTLLSIGIFLNGAPVKGFQIEYLAKVPEVKDTVHKHSLLHHLCHMVMESSNDTTDLYSEIGPITRASKADFQDLAHNLVYLETECKQSWDRLKLIAKHDCPVQLKQKLVDFLADCAERIIILQIVHKRVINRYRKFLLWLGVPQHRVAESKPNEFCRILSEFALEYRTTRERVQQQIEKKANHRERNKTRGKMIIDVAKFRTQEDRADAELKQLLGSPNPGLENQTMDGTLTWRRRRADNIRSPIIKTNEESFTDGDDEILESLVKTATKASGTRPTPRERKRTRNADRKSLRRTLKNGLTEEEKQHVAALIKTY